MHVEVTIGSDEPKIHPLKDSKKIVIGSSESANIVIPTSAGVSRKHLELQVENEKVYVTDLGSTNGTFINEERLQPGTKTEFTSFFPVRIGDGVYLNLMTEDEVSGNAPRNAPKLQTMAQAQAAVIKNQLKKEGTQTLSTALPAKEKPAEGGVKEKIAQRDKSNLEKKEVKSMTDATRMKVTAAAIIAGIVGIVAYNHFLAEPPPPPPEVEVVKVAAPPPPAVVIPLVIPDNEVPTMEEFQTTFNDMKCVTTVEKKLCEVIPEANSFGGVLVAIDKITVFLPENTWYKKSIETLPLSTVGFRERSQAIAMILLKALPEINWKEHEKNIFFVFYRIKDSKAKPSSIFGIRSDQVEGLRKEIPANVGEVFTRSKMRELRELLRKFTIIKDTVEPEVDPNAVKVDPKAPLVQPPGQQAPAPAPAAPVATP